MINGLDNWSPVCDIIYIHQVMLFYNAMYFIACLTPFSTISQPI